MTFATLVMMSRWPEPGRSKTRLIPALGRDAAARLQRAFLEDLLENFGRLEGIDRVLAVTGERGEGPFAVEVPPTFRVMPQPSGDLGQRMAALFDAVRPPVVFVGSDAPTLPPRAVTEALRALDRVGAVFQPALDGGYTLAGFAAPPGPLLDEIPWGGERVLETTLDRARAASIAVGLLDPWYDVDSDRDLRLLAGHLRISPDAHRVPRTRAALETLENSP